VARISTRSDSDTLPCRSDFQGSVEVAKQILTELPETSPELLAQANIHPSDWALLLRATVEKMRGENAATIKNKQRFIDAVLGYCKQRGVIKSCEFIGSGAGRRRRQDYEIVLPDNTRVCVEAKGCGDGNNMNIWDRPSWADEFVVWSLCPESLAKDPGMGVWSAVSNRLMQKITVEQQRVEAFVFWDDRCGTPLRKCPKKFGVHGDLRSRATDLEGQAGAEDWIPPHASTYFPNRGRQCPPIVSQRSILYHPVNLSKPYLAPSTYLRKLQMITCVLLMWRQRVLKAECESKSPLFRDAGRMATKGCVRVHGNRSGKASVLS
jgi:hypothetical protein